jgi:tRNA-specific 2-thiouridylase
LKNDLEASQLSWTFDTPVILGTYSAKTRYRQEDSACQLVQADGEKITLHFDCPQWAVTPGQSAVLYDGQRCLGGGIIIS